MKLYSLTRIQELSSDSPGVRGSLFIRQHKHHIRYFWLSSTENKTKMSIFYQIGKTLKNMLRKTSKYQARHWLFFLWVQLTVQLLCGQLFLKEQQFLKPNKNDGKSWKCWAFQDVSNFTFQTSVISIFLKQNNYYLFLSLVAKSVPGRNL